MSTVVLLYRPELGRILKELKFCYPAEGAMWLEQMVYWCRKKMGYLMRDGRRFIYNAYDDWTKDQITTLSSWKFGKMIRQFRQWGWITTACFAHLKEEFVNPDEVPEEFHPYNTSTWVSLNEKVIEEVIGWNAFAQETDTPTGTNSSENLNPFPSTEIANATVGDCKRNEAKLQRQKRSIYKDYQNITKSIPKIDLKKNEEDNQEVDNSTNQVEILTTTKEQEEVRRLVTESLDVGQNAATSLDGDEKIELAQQFLASLNTAAQRAERYRTPASDQIRRVRIPGLDEETHEILWKHQATLEKLNADLNAERIKSAIADNPQHLEDAIEAFKENSAKGAKTKEAATGFLFNALRHGWKPRQSSCSASTSVQVYTPPPQMLEDPLPLTLEQLVERKLAAWRNARILRPGIEAWVQQTNGVIMTHDGPALADATNAPLEPDLEPTASEHLETPALTDRTSPEESALQPELDSDPPLAVEQSQEISSDKPQQELHQAFLVSSHQTPPPLETAEEAASAAEPSQSPTTPPKAKQKQQRSYRQLQPVEILTSAGEWVGGYFVHSCIAVANLIGTERQYTLFDADGETYGFLGQTRPPQNTAGAT